MAAEGIQIHVTDDTISSTLDRVDRAAQHPAEVMASIAGYLVTSTQWHFERQAGPDGPWPRLSPRTANRRIGRGRRGYDNMLRVTNRLYSSITGASTDSEAIVGTNAIQAALQHFGGTVKMPEREQDIFQNYDARTDTFDPRFRKRSRSNFSRRVKVGAHTVTIPARPFLYLDDQDRAAIIKIAEDGLRQEIEQP